MSMAGLDPVILNQTMSILQSDRLEPSIENRETVLEIFSRYFNCQSFMPDQNGTYRSPDVIHRDCAMEIYSWLRSQTYFRLWAYPSFNWYSS